MQALLLAAVLGALPPPPTGAELAAAEADLQEVFGRELKAADTNRERVALAEKLISTAAGSRPAARYALLEQARELATTAGDSTLGIRAVEGLVEGFGPEKPRDAAQWAAHGHRLWNQAGDRRPADRLRGRLDAAECYLRALADLAGFQKAAVEGRLRGLGWKPSPIDFNFDESTEGWTAGNDVGPLASKDGQLTGEITGGDPFILRTGLHVPADDCRFLEVRLACTWSGVKLFHGLELLWISEAAPHWQPDNRAVLPLRDDHSPHVYRFDLRKAQSWNGQTITGLRIDPGHVRRGSKQSASFSIDYIRGSRH